jgi:nucleotide-binding universal stress UspA family protein
MNVKISENKKQSSHYKVTPLKKVLIALDYDPTSRQVAKKGFSLAKTMNAEVVLLHVIADATYYSSLEYSPVIGFGDFSNTDFFRIVDVNGLKKASENFLDELKKHLGDKTIRTTVEEGDTAESILKVAKHLHADMIVMGSHSRSGLEQILLGSVTEKVLHHTSIPLYIIPTKEKKSSN